MQAMAATACMKSGMVTMHGIDVLALLVQHFAEVAVLRRLLELLVDGGGLLIVHVAQRHDVLGAAQPLMSLAALPPAPMEAIFSFSLGDL